ncbi:hydroxymethylbilane synthase [Anaerosporobacter sp.]|uniref:hydroxymethylbilane synthase n=1 Tax=Anaerosporobacter sp. TaxID=1872529 RepID=UPI00286EF967|nr:hydroxymethylbilane synthase [Anaerosporobacter sp.]
MKSMIGKKIRIGSRESKLAVTQSEIVMAAIKKAHPEIELELVTMKTTGDRILDRSLDKVGGKGLFVKELDIALREGRIDLSVHSLKDMPMEVPEDLPLIGFSKREDPRDALILKDGFDIEIENGIIGSSSKRRVLQLKKLYPNLQFETIRGNVQTRLKKMEEQNYNGIILALAGIKRLGLEHIVTRVLSTDEMIPAAGQGILAIQGRRDFDYSFLDTFLDRESEIISTCERAFVTALNGGCSSPIAAYAQIQGNEIMLQGLYCEEDSEDICIGSIHGEIENAGKLGETLAKQLKKD